VAIRCDVEVDFLARNIKFGSTSPGEIR